jgi:hypothetical protein
MPVYRVQGPDGRIFRVQAPDGATEEQVLSFVYQQQQPKNARADALRGGPVDMKQNAEDNYEGP